MVLFPVALMVVFLVVAIFTISNSLLDEFKSSGIKFLRRLEERKKARPVFLDWYEPVAASLTSKD